MTLKEKELFFRSLREDGVDCLYFPPAKAKVPAGIPGKEDLVRLREKALVCTKCSELAAARTNVVFGAGNVRAQLMFVGEAPGREEDLQGLPFIGRSGQLLTKIIESIGLDRKQVFITSALKCRPPENRAPKPDEIINCDYYLMRQIDLIRPKIICALGTHAAQALLKTADAISSLRGKFHNYRNGSRVICTYHPAYLLRNPAQKREVWEDMKMIKKEMSTWQ